VKWEQNRNPPEKECPVTDYVGDSRGFGGAVEYSVWLDEASGSLSVVHRDNENTNMPLELYGKDSYSAWPVDREVRIKNSVNFRENVVGILKIQRDEKGIVDKILWEYCSEETPTILEKL